MHFHPRRGADRSRLCRRHVQQAVGEHAETEEVGCAAVTGHQPSTDREFGAGQSRGCSAPASATRDNCVPHGRSGPGLAARGAAPIGTAAWPAGAKGATLSRQARNSLSIHGLIVRAT